MPNPITAEDVKDFLRSEFAKLREVAPGYLSLKVEVGQYTPDSQLQVSFQGYCSVGGSHSPCYDEPGPVIDYFTRHVGGRRESDLKRKQAAAILAEADRLEAAGK